MYQKSEKCDFFTEIPSKNVENRLFERKIKRKVVKMLDFYRKIC